MNSIAPTVSFKKKTGDENFPNVNLVWSICQLIVYLTIPIKSFLKMSLNFDVNSNLSVVRRFHTMEKLENCVNFILIVSVFFCNQLYSLLL
jgi:hypothetical protein